MKDFMDKDFLLETETARKLYHEHAARVGMAHHFLQYQFGALVVVAELRAAVGVREYEYSVKALGSVFFFESICNQLGLSVYAADGGNYPQLVAYADVAVFPFINLYLARGNLFYGALHLTIGIFEVLRKVGVHVVRMHVAACGDIGGGISYA